MAAPGGRAGPEGAAGGAQGGIPESDPGRALRGAPGGAGSPEEAEGRRRRRLARVLESDDEGEEDEPRFEDAGKEAGLRGAAAPGVEAVLGGRKVMAPVSPVAPAAGTESPLPGPADAPAPSGSGSSSFSSEVSDIASEDAAADSGAAPGSAVADEAPPRATSPDPDDEEAFLLGSGAEDSGGEADSEAGLDDRHLDVDMQANLRQIAERVQVGGNLNPEVKPFDAFLGKLHANAAAAAKRKPLGILGEDPNAKFSSFAEAFEKAALQDEEELAAEIVIEPKSAPAKADTRAGEGDSEGEAGPGGRMEGGASDRDAVAAEGAPQFEDGPLLTETEDEGEEGGGKDEETAQEKEALTQGLLDDVAEESGSEDEDGGSHETDEEEQAAIRHELGLNSDGELEDEDMLPAEEPLESESESSIESEQEEEAHGFTWEREEPGLAAAEEDGQRAKKRRPKNEKVGRRVLDAAGGYVDVEAELSEDEEYQAKEDEDEDADGDGDLQGLIGKGRHTARDVERAAKQHQKWLLEQDEKELDDVVDKVRRGYNRKRPGGLEEAGDAEGLEAARMRLAREQEKYDFSGLKDLFRNGPGLAAYDNDGGGDEKAEVLANLEAARKRKLQREQERPKMARTDSGPAAPGAVPEAAAEVPVLFPGRGGEVVAAPESRLAWGTVGAHDEMRKPAMRRVAAAGGAGHFIGLKRRAGNETEVAPQEREPLTRVSSGAFVFQRADQPVDGASKVAPRSATTPRRRSLRSNAGSLRPPTPAQPRVSQIASLLGAGGQATAQPGTEPAREVPEGLRNKLYGILGKPRSANPVAE